ncbi:carboxymuconolactone decarboxylase family protein [Urechidicola croceus]|uniref:Carboxymuconolactone decarboxylase n=1 Tax=Urechidicola croceus TaxID=1850246 RepID=A0A1D8P519_9FLAO|nr:carboxymuconolactone decarboxylase family protein [Urechidicola croceus]AOW19655.1 carboxymuconolactone decarboxylase [Urechidicola croceus]
MKQFKDITIGLLVILLCISTVSYAQNNSYNTNALNSKDQSIITIASLTAKGDLENLKRALVQGLENELTINEIKEVLIHLYAYSGFPRSIRGLQTFIAVLEERKAQGISDIVGRKASVINSNEDKYERGKSNLEELIQSKLKSEKPKYQQFSPEIDTFLKEHLFSDIFDRDVLTYKQRELVTVSVLITLGDLEPMLRSHMNICFIQGITSNQLEELIKNVKPNTKNKHIKSAKEILKELNNKL